MLHKMKLKRIKPRGAKTFPGGDLTKIKTKPKKPPRRRGAGAFGTGAALGAAFKKFKIL